MKTLLVILSLFLFSQPSFGQSSERPETIVIPVATLGKISETRRQIIQNTMNRELTKYFRLVPQDKFEAAQEKAFEELDYEECTEDQCIILMQEFLQVENVFSLQLVEENGDTQLSLTWVGLDEKKVVSDFCEGCKTNQLNEKIVVLMKDLVRQINQGENRESIITDTSSVSVASSEYHFRGIFGNGSSENSTFSNLSIHFLMGIWGIGLSEFSLKNTSSANEKYELHNQSVDISYTFKDKYNFTVGTGLIVNGEAKSSTMNLKSTEVSGYRAVGLLGTNFGSWEALGGFQYSIFEYKNFTTTKNLSLSGGLIVFGVGKGF